MHVFQTDSLWLDSQLVCSFLRRANFFFLSLPPLPIVLFVGLKACELCYCMLWHVHKCCPCLVHNLSIILVRLYVWGYIISQETHRFSGSYTLQSSILQSYQNLRCGSLCRCSHLALCKFPKKRYLVAVLHSSDSCEPYLWPPCLDNWSSGICALVITNNS